MTIRDKNKGGPDDPGDPADLARRFADLWQAQMTAMAADPALAKSVQDSMALWQQATQGFGTTAPAGFGAASGPDAMATMMAAWNAALTPSRPADDKARDDIDPSTAAPPGPEAATDTFAGGERLLHELDRRLARIEDRLDRLESGSGESGGESHRSHRPRATARKSAKRQPGKRPPKP